MNQIALKAKQAISQRYGTGYTVGNIAETICKMNFCRIRTLINDQTHFCFVWFQILHQAAALIGCMAPKMFHLHTHSNSGTRVIYLFWQSYFSPFQYRSVFIIGRYGFLLPTNQIVPNSLEVIDGLIAMVREAKTLQYLWTYEEFNQYWIL